jgi:hypothetical protein
MIDPVCSNCGSDRLGAVQRGIDNWPVAQCYNCGPKAAVIPEEDGTEKTNHKRTKAIASAAKKPIGSKKAIHTVLRPLVERTDYRPKVKSTEAKPLAMWE